MNCDQGQRVEDGVDAAIERSIAQLRSGRTEDALLGVRPLDSQQVASPEKSTLIGLICLSAADYETALNWFNRSLSLDPANAQAWLHRGAALQQLGRAEALACYDEAHRLGLAEPALFYNRGNLLRAAGRLDEAIASYDAALRLNPAYPEALRAGALVLRDLGYPQGAIEFLDEAVRLSPSFTEALIDRGDILQGLDRLDEAIACYDRALNNDPDNAAAWNNLGAALLTLGRYGEADKAFDAALRADPHSPQAWNNRGNLMLATQRPEAALSDYERALALRADYSEALIGRAGAQKQLGRLGEALAGLDNALALQPDSDHAKNNKAVLLLLRGEFEQGWDFYESRWIISRTPKHALKLAVPEWEGQKLDGKNIIVFDEQGFGDTIQFVRFCLILTELGANVTFFCRRRLHRLFKSLAPPLRLIDRLEPGDLGRGERFDFQIALCSLPRALKTRLHSIPTPIPYLFAEPAPVQKWAARLGSHGLKVGICWRGSANLKADRGRAVPLALFERLIGAGTTGEGVRLISLQRPADLPPQDDLAGLPWLERMGADFDAGPDSFIDTAALMQSLDLIVSCDTSTAHLAGALGRPVTVLLQPIPDWRWLLDREDCPWYPSMRLMRQSRQGDWSEPMSRVAEALRNLAS
ncbi:tetratricopeptide repeat protein [Methylocella tundrae]|uniref:Tetratricopeptide TPR_2 repeat protein n=1 Tax=Methylocella tundrae TaxID=227605 RepID=A0A4V6IMZ3_METTU|nr:tetratricopeptide repeat protein [Methylocella tundrae]WPP04195.1 tetratricopeptide repeat protein [Methylocella tundrae]VFU10478.1 Tetratricopeptide TPR_2 repeat protein [Methylocella tundrae]